MHPAEPPRAARLPLWKRLLFATFVVAVVVSLPEVLCRWGELDRRLFPSVFEDPYETSPQGLWKILTYDPVTFWKGRPFAPLPGSDERLNARGLRGSDFSTRKPLNVERIVCMGDSGTFGVVHHGDIKFTYDPTYSTEIERLLNDTPRRRKVEVVNAGVIGYSTLQGLRQLKHIIREWEPNVITIRYGVNDHGRLRFEHPPTAEPRNAFVRAVNDLLLEQRSFQFLIRTRDTMQRTALRRALAEATTPRAPAPASPAQNRVPLSEFDYNLRRLVTEARALGAQVVLLTAPLAPLVDEILTNQKFLEGAGYASYDDLVAAHHRYEDAVRTVAADLRVALVDSSRRFAERGAEEFFTRYDLVHPNGEGHRAIARDLADLLQAKGMVSP